MSVSGQDNQNESQAEQKDALSRLLSDACPAVPAIRSESANRIFDDAIRALSSASDSPCAELARTRIALSAAFCICVAAGMLLMRSMASVQAGQHRNVHYSVAINTRPNLQLHGEGSHAPELLAEHLQAGTKSPVISRKSGHKSRLAAFGAIPTYETPAASVCSMGTFTIYTLSPENTSPANESTSSDESDEGSLIVSVVNRDAHGDNNTPLQNSDSDLEKTSKPIEDQQLNMLLVSQDSGTKALLDQIGTDICSTPNLIAAGLSTWLQDKPQVESDTFTSGIACRTIELSLPDYNSF